MCNARVRWEKLRINPFLLVSGMLLLFYKVMRARTMILQVGNLYYKLIMYKDLFHQVLG